MMMLLILTSVLGYELKTAVGTSVFIMAFTAFTGSVSHFAIGGAPDWTVLILCMVLRAVGTDCGCFVNKATAEDLKSCDRCDFSRFGDRGPRVSIFCIIKNGGARLQQVRRD